MFLCCSFSATEDVVPNIPTPWMGESAQSGQRTLKDQHNGYFSLRKMLPSIPEIFIKRMEQASSVPDVREMKDENRRPLWLRQETERTER